MFKLVAGIITLVALAILIVLNINNQSTINLFGAKLENVSVVVIALVGFALGLFYSFVGSVRQLIARRRKAKHTKIEHDLAARAVELRSREELASSSKN